MKKFAKIILFSLFIISSQATFTSSKNNEDEEWEGNDFNNHKKIPSLPTRPTALTREQQKQWHIASNTSYPGFNDNCKTDRLFPLQKNKINQPQLKNQNVDSSNKCNTSNFLR